MDVSADWWRSEVPEKKEDAAADKLHLPAAVNEHMK